MNVKKSICSPPASSSVSHSRTRFAKRAVNVDCIDVVSFGGAAASRLQVQLWMDQFAQDLGKMHSRLNACTLLANRVLRASRGAPEPHTTCAGFLLGYFVLPLLASRHQIACRELLAELAALVFVLPPRVVSSEALLTTSYFDEVRPVQARFIEQRGVAHRFHQLMAAERRIVNREVTRWQSMFMRGVCRAWHGAVRDRKLQREHNVKLFTKTTSRIVVLNALSSWRVRSKAIHLKAIIRKNIAMNDKVRAANHNQLRVAGRLQQEQAIQAKRKGRMEDIRAQMEAMTVAGQSFEDIARRVQGSYGTIVHHFQKTVFAVFGDAFEAPRSLEAWLGHLDSSVVESTRELRHRVEGQRYKFTPELLARLFAFAVGDDDPAASTDAGAVESARAERICNDYRFLTGDIFVPATAVDILRGDQLRQRIMGQIVLEILGGGFCGLMLPRVSRNIPRLAADVQSWSGDEHKCSTQWFFDTWNANAARLDMVLPLRRQTNQLVLDTLLVGDNVQSRQETIQLFKKFRAVSFDNDLPRAPVQSAIRSIVLHANWPLVDLLYPKAGISSAEQLQSYLSAVAEVEGRPLDEVLAVVGNTFAVSPLTEFQAQLGEESCRGVLYNYRSIIRSILRMFCTLSETVAPIVVPSPGRRRQRQKLLVTSGEAYALTQLQFSDLLRWLEEKLDISCDLTESNSAFFPDNTTVQDERAAITLVAMASVFRDPSPFTPLDAKLSNVFEILSTHM